ncbi:unnamed protein product [Miscanthus lutarioriparius]|uniref:Uncharacterized protein n=1 Tax=Miscanthus lutarioriparius TaxID=422564 RepID=A0A811QW48_9POAL|nr:unnamed protein product [Miscanthus lutarioriparius]
MNTRLYSTYRRVRRASMHVYAGVNSVAITGDTKDRLEVVGESIDIACLINHLRKKVCRADIVVVEDWRKRRTRRRKKKRRRRWKKSSRSSTTPEKRKGDTSTRDGHL